MEKIKICIGCKREYKPAPVNERNISLDNGYCAFCETAEAEADKAYYKAHPCQCP